VGANFAGIAAAQQLGDEFDVTVVDRSPWFEWRPNIHELLSGVRRPADLRLPRTRLVARAGHRFVRAEVADIDAEAGRLTTARGRRIGFDACIVAVGGVGETFGVRGADRHALPFKSVDDCHAIGRRLAGFDRQRGSRSVVIVGGGLEGVEALGEILRRNRDSGRVRVEVVEAGPRLLPEAPAVLGASILRHCAELDVRFHTGARVTAVTPARVRLDTGDVLRSDLTIWTGGASPPPLLVESGLAARPRQWAPVTATLQSRRHDNVFVAGDAAGLPRPLAKQAFYALQMGECAAQNVARAVTGRRLRTFSPSPRPMLVAFGDLDTYLVTGRRVLASPALAAVKDGVMQITMAQLDPPVGADALAGLASRFAATLRARVL
jgi:NADH:quinone reductase (non-electrogenic)